MNQQNVEAVVKGIFDRLGVDPSHGLDFDEFAQAAKSQPLLLECFTSQQFGGGAGGADGVPAERKLDVKDKSGWLTVCEMDKKGKLKKWEKRWVALRSGIISYYEHEEKGGGEGGTRLGRVDLGLEGIETSDHKDGGGKSGTEPPLPVLPFCCTPPPLFL